MAIAIITGASGNFGRLLSDKLSQNYEIVDISRSSGVRADITNEKDILKVLEKFEGSTIKVLVNNAALIVYNPIEKISSEEWDSMFDVNVKGVFLMIKHLIPKLKESQGVIVNISSITGRFPMANALAYCASKAALDMITKVCAKELGGYGITVFGISPAMMIDVENTQRKLRKLAQLRNMSVEALLEQEKEEYPYVCGESVASLLAYILSNEKIYRDLHGQTLNMGG